MSHNIFKEVPHNLLASLLNKTDEFAFGNVIAGRGGPFGASVGVYNKREDRYQDISGLQANAVLAKGIGSAHAESEALSSEIIERLEKFLSNNISDENYVIMSSSGESCVACFSKEEIVSQYLVGKGLLSRGRFIVTYGATYEDTATIAKFNDLKYLEEFQKGYGQGSIPIVDGTKIEINDDVKRNFSLSASHGRRSAIVSMPNMIQHEQTDCRAISPLELAEARALRSACEAQKERGIDTPWNLREALLYTMLPPSQVGSLVMSEALWCNIGKIITYWQSDFDQYEELIFQEGALVSNDQSYTDCAHRPYDTSEESLVRTFHLPNGFKNLAQHAWREKLNAMSDTSSVLYNGKPAP